MKAILKVINKKRGMYAAEIEGIGDFVIFEVLDSWEPEIGDIILHHDFFQMGGQSFQNVTQNYFFHVFVEDVCGESLVRKRCLF